ncbi:MAG: alpha amylase family protein [bacterium]|nr:family 10 glycosylhydrolase [Candidatus Sumerlaeota bacterium]
MAGRLFGWAGFSRSCAKQRLSAFVILLVALTFACSTTVQGARQGIDPGRVYLWAESSANLKRLGSTTGVVEILDKMKGAGIDTLIIEVKPVHGHVVYPSKIAPRLKLWKGYQPDPNFDVIAVALAEGHKRGIRVIVALNVFAEGLDKSPDSGGKFGVVFEGHTDWAAWNYAMPAKAPTDGTSDTAALKPIYEHDKSLAIFVSPNNPDVRKYELSIIREIAATYRPDGIVLDRTRFNSIESDFSPSARAAFEKQIGRKAGRWPEDIVTWQRAANGTPKHVPGPLFDKWLYFRAKTIRDFFSEARRVVKGVSPSISFGDYVGSWYGDYWNEGLNWASDQYDAHKDHKWAPRNWKYAGYAGLLDVLFTGLYYKIISAEDATAAGSSAGASVEGGAAIVNKAVGASTKSIGSINLDDYKGDANRFLRATRMCMEKTCGVMLFDLIYLDEFNWWSAVKQLTTDYPPSFKSPAAKALEARGEGRRVKPKPANKPCLVCPYAAKQ